MLTAVELDTFNDLANVKPLYADNSPLLNDRTEIITSWSSATGRNTKAGTRGHLSYQVARLCNALRPRGCQLHPFLTSRP